MRGLIAGLLLLALTACTPAGAPPAPPQAVTASRDVFTSASFRMAPGDTLRYTLTWTPGARAQGYLVTTTTTDPGWTGLLTGAATTGLSMAFTPIHLTPWDSVHFNACVTSTAPGKANSSPTCTAWTLVRGPTPPGGVTVDSSLVIAAILVRPKAATVATIASMQFCAYAQALDGKVRLISGQETLLACQQHYDTMANRLPGYPVAMSYVPSTTQTGMGLKLVLRTPQGELAHVLFAGPFQGRGA